MRKAVKELKLYDFLYSQNILKEGEEIEADSIKCEVDNKGNMHVSYIVIEK